MPERQFAITLASDAVISEKKPMENTLHHQLKEIFRDDGSEIEVKLGRYRIDVINGKRLVEIQRSGLSSIRRKILNLCDEGYLVDVVKPVVARKRLVKLTRKNGRVSDARWSPKKGSILSFFDELIYFTEVFPHPNLKMIVPVISVEEIRYPGQGRKRWRRKGNFLVKDRKIIEMHETHEFSTVCDLQRVLPKLPRQWDTSELAKSLQIPTMGSSEDRLRDAKNPGVQKKLGSVETRSCAGWRIERSHKKNCVSASRQTRSQFDMCVLSLTRHRERIRKSRDSCAAK